MVGGLQLNSAGCPKIVVQAFSRINWINIKRIRVHLFQILSDPILGTRQAGSKQQTFPFYEKTQRDFQSLGG